MNKNHPCISVMIIVCAFAFISCKDKKTSIIVCERENDSLRGPKIEFLETTHNFDTINTIDGGRYSFCYSNTGDRPLVISKVLTNCGCLSTHWSSEPLKPGKCDTISIQITTRNLGNLMKAVVIKSNAVNEPVVTLRMTGYVVRE